jgi:hypothetical protein
MANEKGASDFTLKHLSHQDEAEVISSGDGFDTNANEDANIAIATPLNLAILLHSRMSAQILRQNGQLVPPRFSA